MIDEFLTTRSGKQVPKRGIVPPKKGSLAGPSTEPPEDTDAAARQLAKDAGQKSSEEEEKESSTPPGGFPVSPGPSSKPAFDPPSPSNSTPGGSRMGDEGGAVPEGSTAPAAPAPAGLAAPRLSIKIPTPHMFSGTKEDLEPEAFDNWCRTVKAYLNIHGVSLRTARNGHYVGLYTSGRAKEAYFQAIEDEGEDLTGIEAMDYLRSRFQSSKNVDKLFRKYNNISQVENHEVRLITHVATDLAALRGCMPKDNISDHMYRQIRQHAPTAKGVGGTTA